MPYKRYVARVLILGLCALCAVSGFNYTMDPGNIFGRDQMLRRCGDWLLDGQSVAVTQNYDERLLQKYLIEHDSRSYDVVALGSSRSMGIGQELFPGQAFKNYSVSGACMEDDIALYFLYERYHGKPGKIVIGVDAWLLNRNHNETRWQSIADEYTYGRGRLSHDDSSIGRFPIEKYSQLISRPYFDASVEKIKRERALHGAQGYCLVDSQTEIPENAVVLCPDGSHIPSNNEQAKDAEPEARKYVTGNVYMLERYDTLDEHLRTELQLFLGYLQEQGIEVVLYLTPYHPLAYAHFVHTEKYRQVLEAERYFREDAATNHISVVGAFNPERCGLSNADFLDGMHLRREAVYRILEGKL